jgi:LmbE family N-acetylglucosaminyl deacetylase
MLPLCFPADGLRQVLCLGAHSDDIEIGCGGTLIELARRCPQARFQWVVLSADEVREPETRRAAARLHGADARLDVEVARFRGSYFPSESAAIKDYFEALKVKLEPDLILTHRLEDRHQDHRLVAELTWNTWRSHTILEYEIPKYEGDLGQPGLYVPLAREVVDRKVEALVECFPSQRHRTWFTADLFLAHLRLRGIECNAPSGYAEAFHARKLVLRADGARDR